MLIEAVADFPRASEILRAPGRTRRTARGHRGGPRASLADGEGERPEAHGEDGDPQGRLWPGGQLLQ